MKTVYQRGLYQYQVLTASTPPGYAHLHTIKPFSLPGWFTVTDNRDGTATCSGSPVDEGLAENRHPVQIRAADSHGLTAAQRVNIWVNNVNDSSRVTSPPVTRAEPGELYTYLVKATDPNHLHGEENLTMTVLARPGWSGFL